MKISFFCFILIFSRSFLLLPSSSDTAEFTRTVAALEKAVKEKASVADLRASIVQQNAINETLCGEQCIARWVWRSGKVKPSGIVPWNVQVANSAPDVYLWEKDKGTIGVVQPGLYEVCFCSCHSLLRLFFHDHRFLLFRSRSVSMAERNQQFKF